jgi:hypothetical protein
MPVGQISNFSCVCEDSFVIMQFSPNLTLTMYRIIKNSTIERVSSVVTQAQSAYKFVAVMQNVLIICPNLLLKTSSLLFYDWNLHSLNLSPSNSQITYVKRVLASYNNDILLLLSDGNLQHWSLSDQQFTYLGGFPSQIFK